MKRHLALWPFAGFALSALAGTLLHFLYEWTGFLPFALVSGVNESTWEHMKLLYVPLFVFALVQSRYFRDVPAFWCVKLRGTLTGLVLIPVLFYTYNGAVGKSPDWVNIAIFFVSAAAAYTVEWRQFQRKHRYCRPRLAFATLCAIGALFVAFTFWPPHIGLFRDPVNGGYGLM